ncbi:choice-of-anchor E domain-containing protein [Alteromonas australica]|uniref:Choice-of-anchor E domain-containing protein n=1 Tax=Alteromonas australica TaxID=589873 RepID=A0A075NWL5_9ALTE|nr:choice-of-anchor E domain-containing protein [Alteromonas australica]AIF99034.1 hypothetical protein EP13_10260 [Alteromonas australica]
MLKRLISGTFLLLTPILANAAVIVQDLTVTRDQTDFDTPVVFNLFDNTPGSVLESVVVELFARSSGSIQVENRSTTRASSVTAVLSTIITLQLPDGTTTLTATPSTTRTDSLSTFDGNLDYDGTSGVEFVNLATNDYESLIISSPSLLALFTGIGQSQFLFEAVATSAVNGGGNLATLIDTFASADVRITYYYVPVSQSLGLLLLGVGLMMARRYSR